MIPWDCWNCCTFISELFVVGGFLPTFLNLVDLVSSIADINGMESVPQPLTQNIVNWLFT